MGLNGDTQLNFLKTNCYATICYFFSIKNNHTPVFHRN